MIKAIEPLGKRDRAAFSCGVAALDDWFRLRAGQDEKRNVARVFVAIDDQRGIVGFYSLSSFTLAIGDLPPEYAKHLPRYGVIPAALIGRLARDERVRGEGVGDLLLADAVRRVIGASRSLGVFAIVVETTDEKAAAFYRDFGFAPFPNQPRRLFMPASEAAEAVSRACVDSGRLLVLRR
jgi:GNAT superfamily N-acetyltransferase